MRILLPTPAYTRLHHVIINSMFRLIIAVFFFKHPDECLLTPGSQWCLHPGVKMLTPGCGLLLHPDVSKHSSGHLFFLPAII